MSEQYFDFPLTDGSRICAQRHEHVWLIPNILPDKSIPSHAHEFYEMVLIVENSCRHIYQNDETTLLPGDLFMIPPHRAHGYQFSEDVLHYNCQFFTNALTSEWMEDIRGLTYEHIGDPINQRDYPELANINRKGILHLNADETKILVGLLERILSEQENPHLDSERMKRTLLQLILAELTQIRQQRFVNAIRIEQWKQQMISETLADFESRPDRDWNTNELAERYHISVGYFRSIFREVTGMPPRQYLNQMRINRAVDLIQHQGASLIDASSAIGIHDLNYFSRLCKQYTGYPPSHFH